MVVGRVLFLLASAATVSAQDRPQRPKPDREGQVEYSRCILSGRNLETCRETLGVPQGGQRGEVEERLEAERGAPLALKDQLMNCTSRLPESFEECRDDAKESFERLRGREVSNEEFQAELVRVGQEGAREVIGKCIEAAGTDAAKEACLESEEAAALAARLSGREPGDIKEEDVRGAMREGAAREMAEEVSLCRRGAEDEKAKEDCMDSDDFRKAVGDSKGKASGEVKDSEVRQYIEEGALDDIWSVMENCPADKEAECTDTAMGMLADALGKAKSEITAEMLRRAMSSVMEKQLGLRMRACVQAAKNDTAREACRSIASSMGHGGPVRESEVEMALRDSGRQAAEEVSKDCTDSREECMNRLRERAAESMGVRKEDLGEMELERLNMEGAKGAAEDAARSCTRARETNAQATCEDVMEVYARGRKKDMDEPEKNRVRQELAKDMEKEDMKACFEESTRDGYESCMRAMGDTEKVKDELFSGSSEQHRDAKKKRASDEAAVDAMGEMYQACMKTATRDAEKSQCHSEMRDRNTMAGLEEEVEEVLMKYQRNVLATAARVCEASRREACVDEAKNELVQMGLKPRAFGLVKQLADVKAAAETWAACQELSTTAANATCLVLAQEIFEDLSGSSEIWDQEVAAKVLELGEAYLEGRNVVVRKLKELLLEAVTSQVNCSEGFLAELMDKVQNITERNHSSRNITHKLCRIAWGKARYVCKVQAEDLDEPEMASLSDSLAEEVGTAELGRRLSRRLTVITETYVDQAVEEAAGDLPSTSTAVDVPDGDTTSPGVGEQTTLSGAEMTGASVFLFIFALL